MCNNRTLAEGESRGIGAFLDKYQEKTEEKFIYYATSEEATNRLGRLKCQEETDSER
jgi:hypothetical protein